jgi:ADP-L-glycero-D-manno-heptose 6-epimerase
VYTVGGQERSDVGERKLIVVTGAAGFIGTSLAHRLAAEGHRLMMVDHPLVHAKLANWVELRQIDYLEHDLFLELLLANRIRPGAIFHLGACSSTTQTDWGYLERNNIQYSQHLWRWCAESNVPLIYASSAATYGDGSAGFDDRTAPDALSPLNLYGKSKNEFDRWVLSEIAAGHPAPPRWAGLKFFNVYGPREAHKGPMASVVWQALRQIRTTGRMRLFRSTHPDFPDGGQKRDFVFVEDCVDQMIWLLEEGQVSGIFNSGTGSARTFQDLVLAVFKSLHRDPMIEFIDMPENLRPQYQNYTQADMSKIRAAGYPHAPTTLEDGVEAYLSHSFVRNSGDRP